MICPSQGHSGSSATGHVSDPGGPELGGPGIRTDLHPRPPQQVVCLHLLPSQQVRMIALFSASCLTDCFEQMGYLPYIAMSKV